MPKDLEEVFEVVEALEKVEEAGEDPAGPVVAELIKQYLADQELHCILGKKTLSVLEIKSKFLKKYFIKGQIEKLEHPG